MGFENFNFPGTFRLLNLTPEPPDILHCHNLHGSYFDLRALPWLSQQVPLILNLRDAWLLSGHCAHSFACERWRIGCGNCPDLTIYPAIRRDATRFNWHRKRRIYAASRLYVTTVSKWLMNMVQESALPAAASRVIPNGVDLNIFRPGDRARARVDLGLPPDSRIVLYAANGGSQSPWRDFSLLETALREAASRANRRSLLLCVGEKTRKSTMFTDALCTEYREFEPDPERMVQYYRAADMLTHPARADSSPRVVMEAMACGTPVIATAVGGIPEQVEDGGTGFLVPPGDSEAMAGAIQRLLTDEELSRKMGRSAAARVERHFGLNRQVDGFLSWYDEVRQDWLAWRSCADPH